MVKLRAISNFVAVLILILVISFASVLLFLGINYYLRTARETIVTVGVIALGKKNEAVVHVFVKNIGGTAIGICKLGVEILTKDVEVTEVEPLSNISVVLVDNPSNINFTPAPANVLDRNEVATYTFRILSTQPLAGTRIRVYVFYIDVPLKLRAVAHADAVIRY